MAHRDLLTEQGMRYRTRVCSVYTWGDTARAVVRVFDEADAWRLLTGAE